jgi:hypothetical protein
MIINMMDKTVREKYAIHFSSLYMAFEHRGDDSCYIEWFERVTNGKVTIHVPTIGMLREIKYIIFDDKDYQSFLLAWG